MAFQNITEKGSRKFVLFFSGSHIPIRKGRKRKTVNYLQNATETLDNED